MSAKPQSDKPLEISDLWITDGPFDLAAKREGWSLVNAD